MLAEVRAALDDAARRGLDVSPAGAWLLDNYFVIQEQVREIRASMPAGYYRELPKLDAPSAFAGFPRVYELAIELISHTDGCVELQNIELLVREYQHVHPLTIGELWALPIMLRMGLLENVRRMALRTARDLADQEAADAWVTRFRSASLESRNALARELSAFVHGPPDLTPAFLTRFVQQLRSRRNDFTPLFWLEQWIAEDGMSMEEASQRSTQRLALTQLVMANSITSLRTVASLDWRAFVESASLSDATLHRDPAGIYAAMTFETRDRYRHAVERLAKRAGRAEPEVATIAIAVAEAAASAEAPERMRHVGYYLMDEGRADLERALSYRPSLGERLRRWVLRHPSPVYFGALALATALAVVFFVLPLPDHPGTGAIIAAACLAFLPATAAAIAFVNELVTGALPPTRLSRLDFTGGVPADRRTIVVVPLLLWSEDAAHDAVDRLETQYLANRDPGIRFALLSDVPDAATEHTDSDAAIMRAAVEHLRRLNEKYGASARPFYLFHRPRRWNDAEGVWMGWERKRGKLSEFNAYLRGGARDAFTIVQGDPDWLGHVRYVITLDADTVLPRGAAQALVGTIAHPLVSAEYDESRGHVTHGYGILQPRVSVTLESANRSRFARIYAGHPGIDPYTTAVSDVYQDLYAEGTFTGKGIYDVDIFEQTTRGRFPENALLSHDLIEGIFARAALVTDIEVFDDFPTRYLTAIHRQQRWIRGDWQLLPWLGSRIPGDGGVTPNPLPALSRWKITDNLRRSLVPIATLVWLLLAWIVLPGSRLAWLLAVLVSLAIPLLAPPFFAALRPPAGQSWRPYYTAVGRDASAALVQFMLAVIFLPHQAFVAVGAIGRTLYRVLISRRHLLEWQTASRVERLTASTRTVRWRRFGPVVGSAAIIAALALWQLLQSRTAGGVATWIVALVIGVIWMAMPEIAHVLSAPLRRRELSLAAADRVAALRYARLHWAYFSRFVSADTNWLAPDNHQETPVPVTAMRTSPTNMGLQLLATASAYDLGFLTLDDLLARLEGAFASMDRMRRFHGHFFNWYDVTDLRVLDPPYVSTVDSGNLAGHLIALAELCRTLARQGNAADARLAVLARRANDFVMAMEFRLLFDERRKLFSIGYDARTARLDTSFYDLLASEARLASFVAVAKGDVPAEHWFRLARSLTTAGGATALVSWSGSMFEYLMPVLVMPSRPFSLLDQTHRAAVRRQIHYAHGRGVPWGMSESAYNLRDRHATYQYRAFGVPDLALRRGLANDLVVAPYAAALALLIEPHDALANLATLEELGALGAYGFHDALDYTRPDPGQSNAVVRIAMAHHIGMSLVALDNALHLHRGEGIWQRRFMADPMVRAAELLLDERVPRLYVVQQPQSDVTRAEAPARPAHDGPVLREFRTAHTGEPRVALLGGQAYCVLVSNAGAGYSRANGMAVTRWRADATRDDTGQWVYVRDLDSGRVWSGAHQPTGVPADDYHVTFATDRALWERSDGSVDTRTEIVVVPRERAEIRRVTVTNRSRTPRDVELTSYGEIVLTDPDADRAHPAFQSLFVETEWVGARAAVVAGRRPRAATEHERWCAHVVAAGPEQVGEVTCETDRARFIGRGGTVHAPVAVTEGRPLTNFTGAVLDPIASLRVRVRVLPGQTVQVAFATAVAATREDILGLADKYHDPAAFDRASSLAWTHAQVQLHYLGIDHGEAHLYQQLANSLVYHDAA
ncbi:MAG: glucoamylase family protein, partial [Gemmatimonadaceae bacterium]